MLKRPATSNFNPRENPFLKKERSESIAPTKSEVTYSGGKTLKENGLDVLEEVCPLSARLVVNRVSMKMEKERIMSIVNAFKK